MNLKQSHGIYQRGRFWQETHAAAEHDVHSQRSASSNLVLHYVIRAEESTGQNLLHVKLLAA
jgi:hypothetical protein